MTHADTHTPRGSHSAPELRLWACRPQKHQIKGKREAPLSAGPNGIRRVLREKREIKIHTINRHKTSSGSSLWDPEGGVALRRARDGAYPATQECTLQENLYEEVIIVLHVVRKRGTSPKERI